MRLALTESPRVIAAVKDRGRAMRTSGLAPDIVASAVTMSRLMVEAVSKPRPNRTPKR